MKKKIIVPEVDKSLRKTKDILHKKDGKFLKPLDPKNKYRIILLDDWYLPVHMEKKKGERD